MNLLKRSLVGPLCFLLIAAPVFSAPRTTNQRAGEISAMIPSATLNSKPAKSKEELDWNDLLKTEHSGRVRAGLTDGSIISLGSDSELRIVQHDGASQQTSLEMNFGKVRSQVIKITNPGGKFEMKTPNAVIGVIGTDFYVEYAANKTTVICYEGTVSVTPIGNATVQNNTGQANAANNAIQVAAGQMVEISSEIPPGGYHPTETPNGVARNGILATNVPEIGPPAHHGHTLRWVLIGSAAAVGLGLGIYYGTRSSGCTPPVGARTCQ
jgi:ferric-dicitrate binding protein FerR (iron transport regulator)